MLRVCSFLIMILASTVICATTCRQPASPPLRLGRAEDPERVTRGPGQQGATAKIETSYDSGKDRTTVRLSSVQISGPKDKYHSLHLAPSFSFSGRQPERPSIIDFELQTIIKARSLDSDLYVVFIVDGEEIFLSSNRSAMARPVPGRRWVGERLVFRMPYETFVRITKAKTFAIKFDGVKFVVGEPQLQVLRELASRMD